MKQAKKIFTRILMNNWGGIDHQVLCLNEYVNLFSGKSGSGKSSVMDAMQVVLYGSVGNDFLNRAADDSANKRSVLSYLRGEQKDGTANRENQDFYAHIVLEIQDTGRKSYTCIGAVFEVGKNDMDLKRFRFFSHAGKIPEDEYVTVSGIPYSIAQIQKLVHEREQSEDAKSRGNVNRIYPSREAYLNIVNDIIFGYVDAGRFKTMQKSAIALRMTKGTSQFIKDYMFPKSKEDTITAISEQLAAYREIKERVEDLEKQITLLEEVQAHDRKLTLAKAEQVKTETLLRILEIENRRVQLLSKTEEFSNTCEKIAQFEEQIKDLEMTLNGKREELIGVRTELRASDFEKKKEDLTKLQETIRLCGNEAREWGELLKRLNRWNETDGVCEYVSNPLCNLLEEIEERNITEENVNGLKKRLKETYESIKSEVEELKAERRRVEADYQEQKEMLEDLQNDKKHYSKEVKVVRRKLQEELSARYGRTISVEVFADLFDITDEAWRNAIEGRLGRIKYGLIVEPRYALDAANIFRGMKKREYETVDLINTAAIQRDEPQAMDETLYDAVKTDIPYVDFCLKRYLGHIKKCETVEELHEVKDGVTQDCYSYSNYMFRHLREKDYRYQTIGRKVSKKQMQELEEGVYRLNVELIRLGGEISELEQAEDFERLQTYDYETMLQKSNAASRLKEYYEEEARLSEEIRELQAGTRVAELQKQEQSLNESIRKLEQEKNGVQKEVTNYSATKGKQEQDIKERTEYLEKLEEGFVPNAELKETVLAVIDKGNEYRFEREQKKTFEQLRSQEEEEFKQRGDAREQFNKAFPSYDFSPFEKDNTAYDELLENCKQNFEPKYKAEFDKQYQLIYQMLRENVIATINSEIKEAKRHRREINAMLSEIRFSDSIYQIDILPTDDEKRQFYEMLTAEELNMKVIDRDMEGQLSFGEDAFYQKYEAQIKRLTDKFMPPKEDEPSARERHKRDMEKYADYRTYLKFSMYEQTEDQDGNIKKNYVDDMAGRDSGGEGQNPKYVALLAGFAMLYHQQTNRDTKIRLVLLDEAFSKMDKERSEVCLAYARKLGLQLVVCVPDERLQSLVQNVDCVYAFRRANNRISMIHIDKGAYLRMIEGEADEEENSDAVTVAHRTE